MKQIHMIWISSLMLILLAASASADSSPENNFCENEDLWTRVDDLNSALSGGDGYLSSDLLEQLFAEAVAISTSAELATEFEELRMLAFETDDNSLMFTYAERTSTGIDVLFMGESTSFGVNMESFLERSISGSVEHRFFQLASDGFYVGRESPRVGIADYSAWVQRSGSSAQVDLIIDTAELYLDRWELLEPELSGYYLEIASITIIYLSHAIEPR